MTKFIMEEEPGRRSWAYAGPLGGISIWAKQTTTGSFYGGVEYHSPKPTYDLEASSTHKNCWLIGGPCWHDGSGLQFQDFVLPHLRPGLGTNETFMRQFLLRCYEEYFSA